MYFLTLGTYVHEEEEGKLRWRQGRKGEPHLGRPTRRSRPSIRGPDRQQGGMEGSPLRSVY